MSENTDKAQKLSALSFEKFRELAKDGSLSRFEKIGFYDEFRSGKEAEIFHDINAKLTNLSRQGGKILDIGAGCSDLPMMLIAQAEANAQKIYMADSAEMLANLPESGAMVKAPGMFPNDFDAFIEEHKGTFNSIIVYSVLHYIVVDTSLIRFLDSIFKLLSSGGQCLIGDIPNVTKRNRYFNSEAGIAFHRERHKDNSLPDIKWNTINANEIDDSVVMSILQRARLSGFESYVVPQSAALPMSNRREDILIVKP